jgi:hypothetical protein
MNERLVEDWLTKANERSYQTPFAQALLAEGMQVLRVGHSSHEHGKDVIAIDKNEKIHAYQLKDGDFDLKDFEKEFGQITALVETQIEHPSISGQPRHQPWLVISGQVSMPVEDRIRVHNNQWRKRKCTPLKLMTGRQLQAKFANMAAGFWPQMPEDSHRLFNLYLADGKGSLDRDAFSKLISSTTDAEGELPKAAVVRRLSAANLFASYALSPFYKSQNHWELVQGWTMTAAQIAWVANNAKLSLKDWQPTFQLAVNEALTSIAALACEALQPNALRPKGFELDDLTRSRCTICAASIAVKILIDRHHGKQWDQEALAKKKIEQLFSDGRFYFWGESAVPFWLAAMWALDQLRSDHFSDKMLFSMLSVIAQQNSKLEFPKYPAPYDSADEALSKAFRRLFDGEKAMELQAASSYTLESLVAIMARRLWRNALSMIWPEITKVNLVRLIPDKPHDLLLWNWGEKFGSNQSRIFPTPQSWTELLAESRRDEDDSLPNVIKEDLDFELLFLICFPHRLNKAFVKHLENRVRHL